MGGTRLAKRRAARAGVATLVLVGMLATGLATAAPAATAPLDPPPGEGSASVASPTADATFETSAVAAQAPPPITPLAPVDPGPDGSVPIDRIASPANASIPPLPGVDPGPDQAVDIDRAPVVLDPPAEPSPLTLPLRPGQELIDAAEANALATLGAADPSFLGPAGDPDLDPTKLQPQVESAQLLVANPPTLAEIVEALLNLQIPPPLPVDPLALLQALPDGLPRITYRLCSESTTKEVSCSLTLPLGVPALVDVTGDGTVDVLADLLPAVSPDAILAAVRELLDVQTLLTETQSRLTAVLALLRNPLALLRNPGLLLEALRLPQLISVAQAELAEKLDALTSLVNLGLGLLVLRLPTSETAGGPLPAHVWAVYDVPGHKRLSLGFDGLRRGTTLPDSTLGIFTFDALAAAQGIFDVRGSLHQSGAGESLAVTLGLASVRQDQQGEPFDPTVASAQFAPVPAAFAAHAVVDLGKEEGAIDTTSDRPSRLDAIVVTERGGDDVPFGRFTQLVVDRLPTSLSATLTRPPGGGAAALEYRASSTVSQVTFSDFEYAGVRLDRALTAVAQDLPASIDASLVSSQPGEDIDVAIDYTASSRMTSLDLGVFDRAAANIVATAALRDIPTELSLTIDLPEDHVEFVGNAPLGAAEAIVSRDLGSFAQLDGEHATLVADGAALGASARVSGLKLVDVYFGSHPRAVAEFVPGGQGFVAAGDNDGVHKARLAISNLPPSVSIDLDPTARTLAYEATAVVETVRAEFINTVSGPTVFARVFDLPASIDASWDLGEAPRLTYEASSVTSRAEFFASADPIEVLEPEADHYLSVAAEGVPTEMDVLIDFPNRRLEGNLSAPLKAVKAVARFPFDGDVYSAATMLTGVPGQFDADFADGTYRFRGLSGPLESASLSVSNHPATDQPTGQHLAVRYQESTGEFDASVAVRNLSHVEYSRGEGGQTFRLDVDTEGEPLFVDADVVLAAGGVDDTRLSAVGRIDGLPTTLTVELTEGRLVYRADRSVGLLAEIKVGKIAALSGLGAPLFEHGIAVAARGCGTGPGCAPDETPFCTVFSSCVGAVSTVQLPGLPESVVVDLDARQVELSGWRPPAGVPFQAYVRLLGLIASVPEFEALATLDGLPSPLDITIGPFSLGDDGDLDVAYTASAPIGSLRLQLEAHDTPLGTLRGEATASPLPASLHVTGQIGSITRVNIDNSEPIDTITAKITGVDEGFLSATITDLPAQVDLVVDLPARHAESTASAPLGGVSLLARVPFEGRTWGVFAELTGVPAQWDADFGNGTFRFRGLSGPLGSAALAVTNHAGATAVAGNHLAVHYREATGDVDASAAVSNLSHAEYSRGASSQTFQLDVSDDRVWVDADIVLAAGGVDDTRLAAAGRISGLPNTVRIGLDEGAPSYSSDRPIGILAEVRLGKVAALSGLGAPLFDNGIAVRARGCNPGPGCASDATALCTAFSRCVGVVGTINLSSLPTDVSLDLEARTVSIDGYQGPSTLELYLALEGLPPLSGAVLVTLTGLGSSLDFTLDDTTVGKGEVNVGYTASAQIGSLEVLAETTDTPVSPARGRAFVAPVPAAVDAKGTYGSATDLTYDASTPVDELTLQATAKVAGGLASGLFRLTDVPTSVRLEAGGFGDAPRGFNVPTLSYTASASTLDGLAQVEAALAGEVGPVIAGVDNLYFIVTDLGARTTVEYTEAPAINVSSNPATGAIRFGGNAHVSALPETAIDEELASCCLGFFTARLQGSFALGTSNIDNIDFALTDISDLSIIPGNTQGFLPALAGFLFPGITGTYGTLSVSLAGVNLRPDVDLTFRVDRTVGPDALNETLSLRPTNFVRFHRYDQSEQVAARFQAELGPIDLVCLEVSATPGNVGFGDNTITLFGSDGPQMVALLDSGGAVNDYILDLATPFLSPFPDAGHRLSEVDLGSCG